MYVNHKRTRSGVCAKHERVKVTHKEKLSEWHHITVHHPGGQILQDKIQLGFLAATNSYVYTPLVSVQYN